jgi:hypothetical protein
MPKSSALLPLAALAALTLLGACKKSFPEPWDKFEFTRSGLSTAYKQGSGTIVALYKKDPPQDELVTDWNTHLEAKGYKKFCETKLKDGSLARGYKKASDDRYLFIAGPIGDVGSELSLTEVAEKYDDDEVCARVGKK